MDIDKNSGAAEPPKTIEDLPVEVLREILEFTPKSYKNVALVSKRFHNVVCAIEKFKYPLKLTKTTVSTE